jgi:hypothetical protein
MAQRLALPFEHGEATAYVHRNIRHCERSEAIQLDRRVAPLLAMTARGAKHGHHR